MHGVESVPIVLDNKELHSVIHHEASIIDLKFDSGDKSKCVIREIQWHPVKDKPVHVDLMGIKMTDKGQFEVDKELHSVIHHEASIIDLKFA